MTYYKTNNYKTTSWTPKGKVAELVYDFCATKTGYKTISLNPQDLVRMALFDNNVIQKDQGGGGDRSCWRPGEPIKTSLWAENHADLVQFAKEQAMNKQQVINECVVDYINSQG